MSNINKDNIKRNSRDFSFVDTLGSFILNYEFSRGYDEYTQVSSANKYSYIWEAISAIGGNYAETIYENVLNYIDNVSNVDLCKVKNLLSMITILGIDYNVINDVQSMPVEIVNMIDILSINKHYLLDNKTFANYFRAQTSSYNVNTFASSFFDEMSAYEEGLLFLSVLLQEISSLSMEISGCGFDEKGSPGKGISLSSYVLQGNYLDNGKYRTFLVDLYKGMLDRFIYMKYADAENEISSTHDYIYEYIATLLISKNNTINANATTYDKQIAELKTKYKLDSFLQSLILDDIENGNDYIEKYNLYLQEVLSAEMERRAATYCYDKAYTEYDNDVGYSITRYSYYRERKVKEYFNFIENTYNSLIISKSNTGLEEILNDDADTTIKVYEKDSSYFRIDQKENDSLLYYDNLSKQYLLRTQYISVVAELLADLTLDLAEIREQMKILMRKSYLKGTFLLLSYVINEYLRYDISKNYGNIVYTDEEVPLSLLINDCISNDNVELIEYMDNTLYFNISSYSDLSVEKEIGTSLSMLNKDDRNPKFYDNDDSKLGYDSYDLPLEAIDEFYRKQLNLQSRNVNTSSELTNFLSLIYDYGANNSFMLDKSPEGLSAEYYCLIWNPKHHEEYNPDISSYEWKVGKDWIGDIDKTLATYSYNISLTLKFIDFLYEQVQKGFNMSADLTVSVLISALSNFISNDIASEISDLNEESYDLATLTHDDNVATVLHYFDEMLSISNDYDALRSDDKYKWYLSGYDESGFESTWMKQRIDRFKNSVDAATREESSNGIQFKNLPVYNGISTTSVDPISGITIDIILIDGLDNLSTRYDACVNELSNLIENYVKEPGYWPYYTNLYNKEITALTAQLASYLLTQVNLIELAILQHLQNHLDLLISYKNEVLNMIDVYTETSALYNSYEVQVFGKTNTSYSGGSEICTIWDATVYKWDLKKLEYTDTIIGYTQATYRVSWNSINPSDPISKKLDNLNDRCSKLFLMPILSKRKFVIETFEPLDDGGVKLVIKGTDSNGVAIDPTYYKKWADAWSAETAHEIRARLEQLVVGFDAVLKSINIELDCLGSDVGGMINIINVNIDNIGDKLKTLLKLLLARIKTLDNDYVQVEEKVQTDLFVIALMLKINRIVWILLPYEAPDPAPPGTSESYLNIKKIENTFLKIEQDYEQLKLVHQEYLTDFPDSYEDTLKRQFKNLYEWMERYDNANKKEIQEKLDEIIESYNLLFDDFKFFVLELFRYEVESVGLDMVFKLIKIYYLQDELAPTPRESEYLDEYILKVLKWLTNTEYRFEETATIAIYNVIPLLPKYIENSELIDLMISILGYWLLKVGLLDVMMKEFKQYIEDKKDFLISKIGFYNALKEIFLKYNGTDIGYDPFYNYKNKTHSSYQIHPYLYNFIEKSNLVYPLANTFFVAFYLTYERDLVEKGLDNLIGKFGNIINLRKYGMLDWSGYLSLYEYNFALRYAENKNIPDQSEFDGAFYPPALHEYLADPTTFILKVQENDPASYYYKLLLSLNELNRIVDLLKTYEKPIREIVQCNRVRKDEDNYLSGEYDIYKYAKDIYGNSLMLFKSYKHLYASHANDDKYVPAYNEKKNSPGELWMRIKNHPIAFPAFDLRTSSIGTSLYDTTDQVAKEYLLNEYIRTLNKYFSAEHHFSGNVFNLTKDSILLTRPSSNLHMRCFFDMELSPDKQTIMLTVPYLTGTNHKSKFEKLTMNDNTFTYSNVYIIVGYIYQEYDFINDLNRYTFSAVTLKNLAEGITNNIDSIETDLDLLVEKTYYSAYKVNEFVGFVKYSNYLVAVYVQKYWTDGSVAGKLLKTFIDPRKRTSEPYLVLKCYYYNGSSVALRKVVKLLDYDILQKDDDAYKYANVVVVTNSEKGMTIGYISEEFLTIETYGKKGKRYSKDSTIVNFTEYTKTVEQKTEISSYGLNRKYPSDTALLQTTDSSHINIYNSFDSFTSYIVNVDFKFVGAKPNPTSIKHFNINVDLGYYPLFADRHGKSRFYVNSALSGNESYNLLILGPENTDVDYTPVILDTELSDNLIHGRVTEDYKEYDKLTDLTEEINFAKGADYAVYDFDLREIFVDFTGNPTYDDIAESGQLPNYKWNLVNTSYVAVPIANGILREQYPTDYNYTASSKYDLLSGQDMIGPNGITYLNVANSNHIDNISAINIEVEYDDDKLPTHIMMSCILDARASRDGMQIPENKFLLLLYAKNSLISYLFYRIIENANANIEKKIYKYEDDEIDFRLISVLSDYSINGKYPFTSISSYNSDPSTFNPLSEVSSYKKLSAMLEFKYSEEDNIDREFPILKSSSIEDKVVYLFNEDLYIYFFALDSFDTIDKEIFYMEKYDTSFSLPMYRKVKVNTISRKYQEFYDKSLTIEATYNVENLGNDKKNPEYGIVQYFNYKNFTSPLYISFKKRYTIDGKADVPDAKTCSSTSKELTNTYLRLTPGQSGRLDIRIDYLEYAKIKPTDIGLSIVGKETKILKSYYITNVSDDKPKFVVSRNPFK